MAGGAQWDFGELNRLVGEMHRNLVVTHQQASAAIAATAHRIVADAQTAAPVDTGFHRSSITADIGDSEAEVGPTSAYGAYLEFGTSRMAPRPHLMPATDRNIPGMIAALEQITPL